MPIHLFIFLISTDQMPRAFHLQAWFIPSFYLEKNIQSSWTKTANILNKAMTPQLHSALVDHMAENPFIIFSHGSTDFRLSKMNLVCVHIFDVQQSKQVEIKFFLQVFNVREDCWKWKTLFDAIKNVLRNDGLDWKNVASIGWKSGNVYCWM